MPFSLALAAIFLGTAVYDLITTRRRCLKYGPGVELNGFYSWTIKKLGLDQALALQLLLHLIGVGLVLSFRLDLMLAFFTGARVSLFGMQIKSLDLEKTIDELREIAKEPGP